VLVDSSVWIDLLNDTATAHREALARAIKAPEPIFITGLILTEILQGLRSDAAARRVANMMSAFRMVGELEPDDYRKAATLYRACRDQGVTLRSTIDCVIAQTCLKHNLPLLSRDKDFESIAQVSPLRLVCVSPR
jgi:predicted nucleic acid-binding protein